MRKSARKTLGYFPTIEGKPGRFVRYDDAAPGHGTGQLCYVHRNFPVVLLRSRSAVMNQIRQTLKYRAGFGFSSSDGRYGIQRVEAA